MKTAIVMFDSKGFVFLIKQMLQALDFEVIEVDSVSKLSDFVDDKNIDVLLTDWTKSDEECAGFFHLFPTVVVSSKNDTATILKALSVGAKEYIIKPFDNDILRSKLYLAGIL